MRYTVVIRSGGNHRFSRAIQWRRNSPKDPKPSNASDTPLRRCNDPGMAAPGDPASTVAYRALEAAEWEEARDAFQRALADEEAPELLDGLARAVWWLGEAQAALGYRERAYAGFRARKEVARAARIAVWLSREYAVVLGNEPAASGWMARAERLLESAKPSVEHGWLDVARAERALPPAESLQHAREALRAAHRFDDVDLELSALAQLGLAEVSVGNVDEGLARLDEAMAAATGGEATAYETLADVVCQLLLACELAGDTERSRRWMQVLGDFAGSHPGVSLLGFCPTCCADVYTAAGDLDSAEQELTASVRDLQVAGQHSRCVHPATRLARMRIMQGRFEEAEQLLAGREGSPEALQAAVELRLARKEPEAAGAMLDRRLREVGDTTLLAVPLLAQLVEARLASGDTAGARTASEQLAQVAIDSGSDRAGAAAVLAQGQVARADGHEDAPQCFERAVELFARVRMPLDAARARLELARALTESTREVAIDLARTARSQFEELGADRDADAASALLRELGAGGRAGPKGYGDLSKRELEVLVLLGEGLSNAEIGERLFISPRTVEHHVGRILGKLSVRRRAEAAAYAVRFLTASASHGSE
jgi:DNA-binding CsgD family transcriptional regulator